MTGAVRRLLGVSWPQCMFCGAERDVSGAVCPRCRRRYPAPPAEEVSGVALHCAAPYTGRAASAVKRYKYYSGSRYLARDMAALMARVLYERGVTADVLTYVPLHGRRKKSRRFDQAELLCHELSQITGIPEEALLTRTRDTRTQTRLSPAAREQNVRGAFSAQGDLAGRRILLVDDVFTTGATSLSCARELVAAGAASVTVACFAKAVSLSHKQH